MLDNSHFSFLAAQIFTNARHRLLAIGIRYSWAELGGQQQITR